MEVDAGVGGWPGQDLGLQLEVLERASGGEQVRPRAVGRKLAIFLNRRNRVRQEGERREIFLRYLGEVATAVASIKNFPENSKKELYQQLLHVAKRKTAEADIQLDASGRKLEPAEEEFGDNVLIVNPEDLQDGEENQERF